MKVFASSSGYCGKRFVSIPPPGAKFEMDEVANLVDEDAKKVEYPICAGSTNLSEWKFTGPDPWILPIHITALTAEDALLLPKKYQMHGFTFKLVGVSMGQGQGNSFHFTSFLNWQDEWYFYDGMQSNKMQTMDKSQIKHKTPQFAVYMRIPG